MAMPPPLERFQSLLRELFQFDSQDLDFGIYRVLNFKRREIEDFITTRLPQRVEEAFADYAQADQVAARRELEQKRHQILASLGPDAFDPDGQLALAFRETPLGREYGELQQQTRAARVADELKESVFNDLHAFFSRYYDEGDIFSKPRRGKVEIPFTGHEDVVLHWANKDQYYIKTGEQFKSYRFTLPDENAAVAFALRNVAAVPNNNRGEKRYFVLAAKDPVNFDDATRTLTIFFEYRPLTPDEKETYGKTENQKPQDKLNAEAEPAILRRVKDPALKARLAQATGEGRPSLLLYHLTRFTRKNTSDFFIHKDLRGFLTRELDDFLKTEVLKTDELLAADPEVPRRALLRAQVVRRIALDLIAFLAQIEDFQKKLFEKRKFVVRTEYCVTLDRLPEPLWDDVLENKAQLEEWRQLYALDDLLKAAKKKKPDRAFLKAHDKLVVDTRHFPETFKWRLLESFEDLDAALDGLCIKSENFQALALLLAKYRERVKCIYIDPPYNTGSDEFIYRDNYQHSCWLAMMADRMNIAVEFLAPNGLAFVSVDDVEQSRLRLLMDALLGAQNFRANVVWEKRFTRSNNAKTFASVKDFLVTFRRSEAAETFKEPRTEKADAIYSNPDDDPRGPWTSVSYVNPATKEQRANLVYPILNPFTKRKVEHPTHAWKYEREEHERHVRENRLWWGRKGEHKYPRLKVFLSEMEGLVPVDLWKYEDSGTTDEASVALHEQFGRRVFDTPKPVRLVKRCMQIEVNGVRPDFLLDFFAGSGTSGEAAIDLNRSSEPRRKFILLEAGSWFGEVILPRLKKVVFCSEWKDGKPAGGAGVSHLLKYQVLEQYEDALNNLELPRAREGELALRQFGDEYLLRYLLEFETAGSPSLLNVERLAHPFAYRLKVQEGDEPVERAVDLIETFNYLLGLHVKKLREFGRSADCQSAVSRTANPRKRQLPNGATPTAAARLYRAVLGEDRRGKSVVVVWRDTAGLEDNPAALQQDRQFIEQTILPALLGKDARPDRLLVNQPCTAAEAEAIEPEFKRLMFAPLG